MRHPGPRRDLAAARSRTPSRGSRATTPTPSVLIAAVELRLQPPRLQPTVAGPLRYRRCSQPGRPRGRPRRRLRRFAVGANGNRARSARRRRRRLHARLRRFRFAPAQLAQLPHQRLRDQRSHRRRPAPRVDPAGPRSTGRPQEGNEQLDLAGPRDQRRRHGRRCLEELPAMIGPMIGNAIPREDPQRLRDQRINSESADTNRRRMGTGKSWLTNSRSLDGRRRRRRGPKRCRKESYRRARSEAHHSGCATWPRPKSGMKITVMSTTGAMTAMARRRSRSSGPVEEQVSRLWPSSCERRESRSRAAARRRAGYRRRQRRRRRVPAPGRRK